MKIILAFIQESDTLIKESNEPIRYKWHYVKLTINGIEHCTASLIRQDIDEMLILTSIKTQKGVGLEMDRNSKELMEGGTLIERELDVELLEIDKKANGLTYIYIKHKNINYA